MKADVFSRIFGPVGFVEEVNFPCLFSLDNFGLMSLSTNTMSWSETPGMTLT